MWAYVILIGIFIIVRLVLRGLDNKGKRSFGRWRTQKAATNTVYEFALSKETGRLLRFDVYQLQITIVVVKRYDGNNVKHVVVRSPAQPDERSLHCVQDKLYRDHGIVIDDVSDSPPIRSGDLTPGIEFQRFYKPVSYIPWLALGVPVTVVDVNDNKATLASLDSLTTEQVSSLINVITQFNATKVQSTTVTGIVRYRNTRLQMIFKDTQARLRQFGRPTERLMLFHATGAENVDS